MHQSISTAILVGGRSKRMGGRPKGLMQMGGVPIVNRLVDLCRPGPIFLVGDSKGPYSKLSLPIYDDTVSDRGAPGGVLSALQHSDTDWTRVLACDLPSMTAEVLERLSPQDGFHVACFRVLDRPQYTISLWHQSALPILQRILDIGSPGFGEIFKSLSVKWLDHADCVAFTNMNTPIDAEKSGAQ